MKIDSAGFIYLGGAFEGTVDFDPNAGIETLTAVGEGDAFVEKLDLDGNYVWAKAVGGIDGDRTAAIAFDKDQNVYAAGNFAGTVDFDPGIGISSFTSAADNSDLFVLKLDNDGNFIWNRTIGNDDISEVAFGMDTDTLSNVYITGSFGGTVDFDPGAGTDELTAEGFASIFIHKMDLDGAHVWAKSMTGMGLEQGYDIKLDDDGNVYTTGRFTETVDFDPNGGFAFETSEGSNEIFLHKLDTDGNFEWVETFGAAGVDRSKALDVNKDGCIIVMTGSFSNTVDFDPGAETELLTVAGSGDAFVYRAVCEAPDPPDPPGCLTGDIVFNNPTCFGFTDGSVTINVTDGMGDIIFVITNEAGEEINEMNSNTANTLGEGWYYFNVTDTTACPAIIDSIFLDDPDQMTVDLIVNDVSCFGGTSRSVIVDSTYNNTGTYENLAYFWSPNPTGENGIGADTITDLPMGDYVLTVNDANGCSITETFTIDEPTPLEFAELGYDPAYCRLFGYQSGSGTVFAAGTGGIADYTYQWTNLQTGVLETGTTWGGLNPGDYEIRITDENNCLLIDTVTVDSLNPIAAFEITSDQLNADCKGTAVVDVTFSNTSMNFANPNNPLADTTFFWDFGLGGSSILSEDVSETFDITYTAPGTYDVCLIATNKNGCIDSACKVITVFDPFFFEPVNIFTPNNDGINDGFSFENVSQSIAEFSCTIYNRWGVKVATLQTINDSWDGKLDNGTDATAGVYFYVYTGQANNGEVFKGQGNTQLVR